MHFLNPIAQRIHHQPDDIRILQIKAGAAAGCIHIKAFVFRIEDIIGGIVYAAVAQSRPEMVALTGVVINNVKNNLYAMCVECFYHIADFINISGREI